MIFKALSGTDKTTVPSALVSTINLSNFDIATDSSRRAYQVWNTQSTEDIADIDLTFIRDITQSTITNTVSSGMYQTVYDEDFENQTANPMFDFTVGIYENSAIRERASLIRRLNGGDSSFNIENAIGDFYTITTDDEGNDTYNFNPTDVTDISQFASYGKDSNGNWIFPKYTIQMNEKISLYKQHAKELLGDANAYFEVPKTDEATDEEARIDAALFIRFKRLVHRDGIQPRTFSMRFLYSVDECITDDVPLASSFSIEDEDTIDIVLDRYHEAFFGKNQAGETSEYFPLLTEYSDTGRGKLMGLTLQRNAYDGDKDKTISRLSQYSDFKSDLKKDSTVAGTVTYVSRVGSLKDPILPLTADANLNGEPDTLDDSAAFLENIATALKRDPKIYLKSGKNVGLVFAEAGVVVLDLQKIVDFTQEIAGFISAVISDQTEPTIGDSDSTILFAGQFVDFLIRASIDDICDHLSTRFGFAELVKKDEVDFDLRENTSYYIDASDTDPQPSDIISSSSNLASSLYAEYVEVPFDRSAIQFRNITKIKSSVYSINIRPDEFNYSSNPTYVDSEGRIVVVEEGEADTQLPFTFLTGCVLWDANNRPLAIAKFNRPIEKSPESGLSFSIRLDN